MYNKTQAAHKINKFRFSPNESNRTSSSYSQSSFVPNANTFK